MITSHLTVIAVNKIVDFKISVKFSLNKTLHRFPIPSDGGIRQNTEKLPSGIVEDRKDIALWFMTVTSALP
jgi:hypothetical protein